MSTSEIEDSPKKIGNNNNINNKNCNGDKKKPIETSENQDDVIKINNQTQNGDEEEDELLSPSISNENESRPRAISVITDDGVGDLDESENAEQVNLDVEKIYTALHQFNVFEKDLISIIVARRISYRQLLRSKYIEKYDEVSFL